MSVPVASQLKPAELAESVSEVEEESSGSDTAHCQLLCDNVDTRSVVSHVLVAVSTLPFYV